MQTPVQPQDLAVPARSTQSFCGHQRHPNVYSLTANHVYNTSSFDTYACASRGFALLIVLCIAPPAMTQCSPKATGCCFNLWSI